MDLKDDISSTIDLLINNIKEDLEPIEVVRWPYVELGNLFSYNLKILTELEESTKLLNYDPNLKTQLVNIKLVFKYQNYFLKL